MGTHLIYCLPLVEARVGGKNNFVLSLIPSLFKMLPCQHHIISDLLLIMKHMCTRYVRKALAVQIPYIDTYPHMGQHLFSSCGFAAVDSVYLVWLSTGA